MGARPQRLHFHVARLAGKLMLSGHTLSGDCVFGPLGERALLEAGDSLWSPCSCPTPDTELHGTGVVSHSWPGLSLEHVLPRGEWCRVASACPPPPPHPPRQCWGHTSGRSLQSCVMFLPWGLCSC